MSSQSSAYAEDRVMPMLAMESLVRVVSGFLVRHNPAGGGGS